MPQPGQMLGDRYRLDDRIAAGGMGEVWRATDTVLGRDIAIKTLLTDRVGDPGFETRFRHEARTMAALHHPGVADVYDFGESGAVAYIVMERVEGTALNQLLAQRGRLSPAETMSIVAQAGRALEAAHQAGIVHRDVKPGNLIIKPDGTVVLVDFGVARSAESAALTAAAEVVGTALYMAPEQVSKQTLGPAVDVYALGAVGYHCLAGRPPFQGDNPLAVAMQHVQNEPPGLPPQIAGPVRAIVMRALRKNPADRFPSAATMADAAERAGEAGAGTGILATALFQAPTFGGTRAGGPGTGGPGSYGTRAAGPGSGSFGTRAAGPGSGSFGTRAAGAAGPGSFGAAGAGGPGTFGAAGAAGPGSGSFGTRAANSGGRAAVPAPGSNGTRAMPGAAGAAAGGFAVGTARPGVPAARAASPGGTSVFPAADPVPAGGGGPGRRRMPLLLAAAAVLLLALGGAVLAMNTGLFGGGEPTDTLPASVEPTGGTTQKGDNPATGRTKGGENPAPGGGTRTNRPSRTPSATPSQTPSSERPTSATPTGTGTRTTTPTDNSGPGGGGDNGGEDPDENEPDENGGGTNP